MTYAVDIATVAALIGDPGRARMLDALLDDRALTAKELAYTANVGASTASAHLAKLTDCGLVVSVRQGRHRYFRLAGPRVAALLEELGALAALDGPPRHRPPSCRDAALRRARTCYDHLAGRLGVAIAEALLPRDALWSPGEATDLPDAAVDRLRRFGLTAPELAPQGRLLVRPCLDWSERRPHLGGRLGRAIAARCHELGWIARPPHGRAVTITAEGDAGLARQFGIDPATLACDRHVLEAAE